MDSWHPAEIIVGESGGDTDVFRRDSYACKIGGEWQSNKLKSSFSYFALYLPTSLTVAVECGRQCKT